MSSFFSLITCFMISLRRRVWDDLEVFLPCEAGYHIEVQFVKIWCATVIKQLIIVLLIGGDSKT